MSSRSTCRALSSLILVYILIVSICSPPLIEVTASSSGAKRANGVVVKGSRPTKSALPASQSVPHGGRREGELLARFRLGLTIEQQRLMVASSGAKEWRLLRGESRVGKVMLHPGQTIEAAILALRANRAVEFAEPNYLIHQDTVKNSVNSPSLPSRSIVAPQSSIPNDPRFAEQWALQNLGGGADRLFGSDVQVTGIWQRSTGNPTVTVAILDSGIDFSHPDLKNQRWVNRRETRDGKDEEKDGFIDDVNGWDFVDNNNNLRDGNGHGTNVAGIIAAEGNNNIGIAGVMWQAGLMSLRVLDSNGVGDTASAIEALDYAGAHGAQVINLSWGSDERSRFLHDAIRRLSRYGSVVVCSAGNDARDSDTRPYYPASFNLPNLISVSASDGLDNLAQFSNFGVRTTTIAAPGVEILTPKAGGGSTAHSNNGAYETISGTSASAAIVSGIVGLFKTLSFSIRAEQVKSLLMAGARKVPQLTAKNQSAGVVSASGADRESGPGGLGASQRNRDPNPNSSISPNSLGNQSSPTGSNPGSAAGGGSSGSSNRRTRRRNAPGPDLPDLDVQKSEYRPAPKAPEPVPSKKRNCSPSLPNCDGKRISNPRWFRAANRVPSLKSAGQFSVASGQVGLQRQLARLMREASTGGIAPLLRSLLGEGSDGKPNGLVPTMLTDRGENGEVEFFRSLGLVLGGTGRGRALSNTTASTTSSPFTGPTVDQFVTGFYQGALARNPSTTELAFWKDQLKDATSLGSASVLATAQYLGSALFLSSDYAARNHTNNGDYVTDLYWGYLQRAPDSSGLSHWTGEVSVNGREAVRLAFALCPEFSDLVTSVDVGSYPTTSGNFSTSRTDIVNRTGTGGADLLSGNVNFSIPILSLPGRSGLDLGLALSYNSRVWSKVGSTVAFDTDRGFPAPGFRLGFPVVQPRFYNSATGTASYLLITPGGGHMELRRVGSSSVYESADGSYTQLTDNGSSLLLRTTDGTQLTYASVNYLWVCTQIKDRNGNYITVNYNGPGSITSVVDTLGRTINFNYDSNSHLQSITQTWTVGGSATTHTWASFSHDNTTIDTNFSGVYMLWPQDNAIISVLTQVGFADGSHVNFEYNEYGQVNKIKRYGSSGTSSLQSQTRYVFDTPSGDSPRVTDRYDWAKAWNGDTNGSVASGEEARTQFTTGLSGGVVTAPDGTVYKEFYGSSTWQRGLTTSTEIWVGTSEQKWTTTAWTQDNINVSYLLNPRVTETNVYDAASNRRRTTIDYTDYSLPSVVTEYAANASTIYRKRLTEYVTSSSYTNIRVIGLPAKIEIKDGSNALQSKTEFTYDSDGEHFTNVTGKTQHDDTNYGSGFVTGRGNLTISTRYDMSSSATTQNKLAYNSLGQVTFTRDAASHQSNISYGDSFSDGVNNRNTHAYPTTLEDADENDYLTQYNFDFGGVTRTEDPKGAVVTTAYDSIGRVDNTTSLASTSDTTKQARTRYEYGPDYVLTYVRGFDGTNEAYTNTQFDGAGRVRGVASDFPGSTGGYKATYTYYDVMGRVSEQTNPTETNSSWTAAGDDSGGFASSLQTYDWKGRPLVTTNQDDTQKTASYSGCGCAGGEVVTLTDEVGRKQKAYSDVFGRPFKAEVYSSSTTVNSTTVTTYNVLDQPTQVREYAGTDSSSTYQDTTTQYDGYGRIWKTHKPEFDASTYNTVTYNADDTVATVTDPRGVVATYSHNDRHLTTQISYSVPSGLQSTVPARPTATFTYDSVGNRLTMSSSVSSVTHVYDTASRMTSETRSFSGVTGNFTLTYSYNAAGALTSLQDAFSATVSYSYDKTGQLTSVGASGSGFPSVSSFINSASYRAWGAPKSIAYDSDVTETATFNERMQPTSYKMAWVGTSDELESTFDYYDDGRVNHAAYDINSSFDRRYEYDFAGRMKEAYTGRESRGQTPTTPSTDAYRQSMTYDAFGNQTARSGKLWSNTMATYSATFTNNRSANNEYDAAGNVVDGGGLHKFDAAGSQAQSITHALVTSETTYHEYTATITLARDGAGAPVKRTQYMDRWDGEGDDPIVQTEETIITYSLQSSVLKMVIDEIDPNGAKTKGHIYAGGRKIAEQDVTSSTNAVRFKLTNPVTATCWETNESGFWLSNNEYDPVGAIVPNWDPYIVAGPPLYPDIVQTHEQLYVNGGDPFNYSGGYTLDGLPISEAQLRHMMDTGAGVAGLFFHGKMIGFWDFTGHGNVGTSGGNFWLPKIGRVWVDGGQDANIYHDDEGLDTAPFYKVDRWELRVTGYLSFGGGFLGGLAKNRRLQDPVVGREDLEAYKARIAKMLQDKTCRDFIKQLFNEVKTLTGKSSNDILDTFDTIKFYWKDEPPWYGGHAFFEQGKPVATINDTVKTEEFINAGRTEFLIRDTTYSFFGETLHHVGVGSMHGDGAMAQALNNILVRQGKAKRETFDLRDVDAKEIDRASGYWHPKVEHFCHAPRK